MESRVEIGKQVVKVILSIITMIILLLANHKMQKLTDCILENLKNEKGHRSSEPIVAPNCHILRINVTYSLTAYLCDLELTLYIDDALLDKYVNVKMWVWPGLGKCLHIPSDTQLCTAKNGTYLTVNGFKFSKYETMMLSLFMDTHLV